VPAGKGIAGGIGSIEEDLAMQIHEIMSRNVTLASPEDTLQEAALMMAELDAGALPVGENDRLVGMITDRDIAIRGDAAGCDPTTTPVERIMSREAVKYCYEDDDVDDIARNMADQQVRRLPVVNREKRLVGIISLGDIARGRADGADRAAAEALRGISRQGSQHSQSPR
jgi:CBS domain-containing protein